MHTEIWQTMSLTGEKSLDVFPDTDTDTDTFAHTHTHTHTAHVILENVVCLPA